MKSQIQIAVLDDYQGVALQMADWSALKEKANIVIFRDHLSDPAALAHRLKPFDVLCVMRERTPLPRSLLQQLPNLKLIVSTGRRNPSIDIAAAKEQKITICNTGIASNGAPELTWGLILALIRHIPQESASLRKGQWQTSVGGDLQGKTIGILGLGNIGTKIAQVAKAFGMNILAYSQNLTPEKAEQAGAKYVSKEELLRQSDIVTLHLVLSDRTRNFIGASDLRLMKPSAYLINTSRGPLINEEALIQALKHHQIRGAALDVFNEEPLPPHHPFRSLDNFLATPHIGFVTQETYQIFYRDTVENILAWFNGHSINVF